MYYALLMQLVLFYGSVHNGGIPKLKIDKEDPMGNLFICCCTDACGVEGRCINNVGREGFRCICPFGRTGTGCLAGEWGDNRKLVYGHC